MKFTTAQRSTHLRTWIANDDGHDQWSQPSRRPSSREMGLETVEAKDARRDPSCVPLSLGEHRLRPQRELLRLRPRRQSRHLHRGHSRQDCSSSRTRDRTAVAGVERHARRERKDCPAGSLVPCGRSGACESTTWNVARTQSHQR